MYDISEIFTKLLKAPQQKNPLPFNLLDRGYIVVVVPREPDCFCLQSQEEPEEEIPLPH